MDFLNNPIILTVLRLSHIIFGMIWVGLGIVGAWIINPAVQKMGEKGNTLLRLFYAYTNYNRVFPIVAGVTVLAGLIMWPARTQGGMDFTAFSGAGDITMAIGALFGILAAGHGGSATGRFAKEFATAAKAYEETDSPSDEQKAELAALRQKVFTHSNISAILAIIAAVAMASARYLG